MSDPDAEPWLPNGFPPPSFVVEPEGRLSMARGRSLAAAILLAAVLLVAGILFVTDGDDGTALKSGSTTTGPSGGITGFGDRVLPSSRDMDPTTGGVEATTPPSFRQDGNAGPGRSSPDTTVTTGADGSSPTGDPGQPRGPTPGPTPGPSPTVPSTPTPTSPPTTALPTTSTTAAPTPPSIELIEPADGATSPCVEAWSVRARVSDPDGVKSVVANLNGADLPMSQETATDGAGTGIWSAAQPKVEPGTEVRTTVRAVDSLDVPATSPEVRFSCPGELPVGEQGFTQAEEAGQVVDVLIEGRNGDEHLGVG